MRFKVGDLVRVADALANKYGGSSAAQQKWHDDHV